MGTSSKGLSGVYHGIWDNLILESPLLDSGVLGFHVVHESQLMYKVIEKEGL
jgi:hypothetical protein